MRDARKSIKKIGNLTGEIKRIFLVNRKEWRSRLSEVGLHVFPGQTKQPPKKAAVTVEMRGVEPLSEEPYAGPSPSAFRVLNSPIRPSAERLPGG